MDLKINKDKNENNFLIIIFIIIAIVVSFYGYQRNIHRYEKFTSDINYYNESIIVFYQPNCPYCVEELPFIIDLSNYYNIVSINVLNNHNKVEKFDISSVPSIILNFNDTYYDYTGEMNLESLNESINQLKMNKSVNGYISENETTSMDYCNILIDNGECE